MNERSFRLMVIGLFLLVPIAVISIVMIAAATGGFGSRNYYWGPMGDMMGMGWIFMLIPLTFLIIVFVVLMLVATRPITWRPYYWGPWGPWAWRDCQDAESVLEERYAKGEISREEFLRIKDDLKANRR